MYDIDILLCEWWWCLCSMGWRFDYAKGYGARFVAEYASNSVGLDAMNVAEYWPEASWEPDG
jgi:hypothetical protein